MLKVNPPLKITLLTLSYLFLLSACGGGGGGGSLPAIADTNFSFKTESSSFKEDIALGKATIVVQRDKSAGAMTVDYATQDGSAVSTTLNNDYIANISTLKFADGELTQIISIALTNDNFCEIDENFTIVLSNPSSGAKLGTITKHIAAIVDDDGGANIPGVLLFKTTNSNVSEDSGSIDISVSRMNGCAGDISVDYKTNSGGTATENSDYIVIPTTTLKFGPGITEQQITVNIVEDFVAKEGNEDFSLSLNNPVGGAILGTIESQLHTVTINDKDILSLGFGLKQLKFSWVIYPGSIDPSTVYKLMEDVGGAAAQEIGSALNTVFIDNIDGSQTLTKTFDISVHRYNWDSKNFYIATCVIDCVKSNKVVLSNNSVNAIGYIKANNPKAGDRFGGTLGRDTVLAVSGDGNTLAVGAALEDNVVSGVINDLTNYTDNTVVGNNSGAVYIYSRNTSTGVWTQQAYIKASNANDGDNFGNVTLSFDGSTLAVGADNEESPASFNTVINAGGTVAFPTSTTDLVSTTANNGAVYVFIRTNNLWSQQAYIKASNTNAGDRFGKSVSLSGDGSILAVGAHYESSKAKGVSKFSSTDNTLPGSGAVYIYTRDATNKNWSETAYVKANNNGGLFGLSVAVSRDGSTFAVGASAEKSKATGVLNGSTNSSTDVSLTNAGAVYIFKHSVYSPGWYQDAYVKASNTGDQNYFGHKVALSGDGATLVVSTPEEGSSITGVINDPSKFPGPSLVTTNLAATGAVYVYSLDESVTPSVWFQSAYLKSTNTTPLPPVTSTTVIGDFLGTSLALSSDGNTIAVGALSEDSDVLGVINNATKFLTQTNDNNLRSSSGAVYVFSRNTTSNLWSQSSYVKSSNSGINDEFGATVSLNSDGSTLTIGTRKEDGAAGVVGTTPDTVNNAKDAGAVYIY